MEMDGNVRLSPALPLPRELSMRSIVQEDSQSYIGFEYCVGISSYSRLRSTIGSVAQPRFDTNIEYGYGYQQWDLAISTTTSLFVTIVEASLLDSSSHLNLYPLFT
ncbi:hypothetical protein BT96DRAFT_923361, partial [Gymnopus androsaceus JB14]